MASFLKKLARAPLDFLKGVTGYESGRDLRERRRYQEGRDDTQIQRLVADARAAGIHPLFALGGATGGASSQVAPQSGNQIGEALRFLQRSSQNRKRGAQSSLVDQSLIKQATANTRLSNARADEVEWQLQNSILKRAEGISNTQQDVTIPNVVSGAQEIKLGQTDPHSKKNREQSLNVKSPMSQIRIGSQNVWIPIDEIDEFFENPLAIGAATYAYHGNKNVDWAKLAREYTGKKSLRRTMRDNIRKHVPVRVRKKHLLRKYASPANFGAMP